MKRTDFNIIKKSFEDEGYILKTNKYINSKQKLYFICPRGHRHYITWGHWQQGCRCLLCANEDNARRRQKNFNIIKKFFEEAYYILLTVENDYKNNKQKLDYICPNGHYHSISWDNFKKEHRCPYCANRPPITIDFIKCDFNKNDYILETTVYINCYQKLYYICPKGHKHSISWNHWQQGHRCQKCYFEKITGSGSPAYKHGLTGTREYNNAASAKRRAYKLKQTPPEANLEIIQLYYTVCKLLNEQLGYVCWQVDHIHPLSKGGLHHENNLQILPTILNLKKKNKWPLTKKDREKYKGFKLY